MYNAKRDGKPDGESNAIPSMGAIEGRIIVLEVVASTALELLIEKGDSHAAQQVLSKIRKAMRAKCEEIRLSTPDTESAIAYAQELLDASLNDANFLKPVTIEDEMLVA